MVHHGNLVGRYFTGRPKSVCVQLGLGSPLHSFEERISLSRAVWGT
nr:unnamed protein product [Callosobruchus chinensis]